MRSNTKMLMTPLANAAPIHARFASTPAIIIGGAMISVLASVQPASLQPEPLSFSKTSAAVLYVGRDGSAMPWTLSN